MAIDKYGAVALRKTYTRYYNTVLHYTISCIIKAYCDSPVKFKIHRSYNNVLRSSS